MKIVAYSDLHLPFCNFYKLTKLYSIIKKENPDVIINLGDLYDFYSFSRFDKDLNIMTPKQEILKAKRQAENHFDVLNNIAPKAKKIFMAANHEARLCKKIISKMPELASIAQEFVDDFLLFNGVETHKSERDYVELDGVIYCHGFLSNPKAHLNFFDKSVVHGHLHTAEIVFNQSYKTQYKKRFAMCVGCLISFEKGPFQYTRSKLTKWKHACAIITDGKPELRFL